MVRCVCSVRAFAGVFVASGPDAGSMVWPTTTATPAHTMAVTPHGTGTAGLPDCSHGIASSQWYGIAAIPSPAAEDGITPANGATATATTTMTDHARFTLSNVPVPFARRQHAAIVHRFSGVPCIGGFSG